MNCSISIFSVMLEISSVYGYATFSDKANKRFNISNCYIKINSEDKYYVEILKLFIPRIF
jgi:hypothetical protein